MSAENLNWAFAHSPLAGTDLVVHLALADLAHSAHDNEIWMRPEKIATIGRTTPDHVATVIDALIGHGLLERVGRRNDDEADRYRLLCPTGTAVVYDRTTRTGLVDAA